MNTLVIAAHGTRSRLGLETIEAVADDVRCRRPELSVRVGYVDVAEPLLAEVIGATLAPACVVPLLLGSGYHARVDIPFAVGDRRDVVVTPTLGADPRIVDVLVERLAAVGPLAAGDTVIVAAAGSSDDNSAAETRAVAELLAARVNLPVKVAYAAARRPYVADAVASVRRSGRRPVVATLLLAPGHFAGVIAGCGAEAVTEPLGPHPALAELVLARFDAAVMRSVAA